jgi:hypothetical protein
MNAQMESRGIALLFPVLDVCGWLTSRPDRFTPLKQTRYRLYRRLGGPQGRSRHVWKISPAQGIDPRTAYPVASRHTDYNVK